MKCVARRAAAVSQELKADQIADRKSRESLRQDVPRHERLHERAAIGFVEVHQYSIVQFNAGVRVSGLRLDSLRFVSIAFSTSTQVCA